MTQSVLLKVLEVSSGLLEVLPGNTREGSRNLQTPFVPVFYVSRREESLGWLVNSFTLLVGPSITPITKEDLYILLRNDDLPKGVPFVVATTGETLSSHMGASLMVFAGFEEKIQQVQLFRTTEMMLAGTVLVGRRK